MGKATIQAQLIAKQTELVSVDGEIAKFTKLKDSLTSFPTTITYVLVGDDNIKTNYNLLGSKYSEETVEEKSILRNIQRDFQTKIDGVSDKLRQKISELESQRSGLLSEINSLRFASMITREP